MSTGIHRSQRREPDNLELELQLVVNHLTQDLNLALLEEQYMLLIAEIYLQPPPLPPHSIKLKFPNSAVSCFPWQMSLLGRYLGSKEVLRVIKACPQECVTHHSEAIIALLPAEGVPTSYRSKDTIGFKSVQGFVSICQGMAGEIVALGCSVKGSQLMAFPLIFNQRKSARNAAECMVQMRKTDHPDRFHMVRMNKAI